MWGRDYRAIILPTVTVIGLAGKNAPSLTQLLPLLTVFPTPAATVIGVMYRMIAATPNESIFATEFNRWVISFCVATLMYVSFVLFPQLNHLLTG